MSYPASFIRRDICRALFLSLLLFGIWHSAKAQTRLTPLLEGDWPPYTRGRASDVVLSSSLFNPQAYVATENGLVIFDVSNPLRPIRRGSLDLGNLTPDFDYPSLALGSSHAYVASGTRVFIINVASASTPQLLHYVEMNDRVLDVAVVGTTLYVAGTNFGLRILDVTAPAIPINLGGRTTLGTPRGIMVVGGYAYLAEGATGLEIIDVHDPTALTRTGTYNTTGAANDVFVAGSYAYVADGSAGLQVLQLSNPGPPARVGGYDTPGEALGVVVTNGYACVADGRRSTTSGSVGSFQLINVQTPSAPTLAGSYDLTDCRNVAARGSYAYVADLNIGVAVLNLSTPATPDELSTLNTYGFAEHVAVSGNVACVAERENGLRIFDVTDANTPILTNTLFPRWASCVAASGRYAYVGTSGGFKVVDLGDLSSPQVVGEVTNFIPVDLVVSGNYAYAASLASLHVVNVTSPTAPVQSGIAFFSGSTWRVAYSGGYAYVATGSDGLQIIDVRNPASPFVVSTWRPPSAGWLFGIAVANGIAYVGQPNFGLHIVDVSDPFNPYRVNIHAVPGGCYGANIIGNRLYAACAESGLLILDLTNPMFPTRILLRDTPGFATDATMVANRIYVTDGAYGLHVICTLPGLQQMLRVDNVAPGFPCLIQSSPVLGPGAVWTSVYGNPAPTGPFEFTDFDVNTTQKPQKFYRARQP